MGLGLDQTCYIKIPDDAIKEYAKRNKKYKEKLPEELKALIKSNTYNYPINKSISESLEARLGVKLWNPIDNLAERKTSFINKWLFTSNKWNWIKRWINIRTTEFKIKL